MQSNKLELHAAILNGKANKAEIEIPKYFETTATNWPHDRIRLEK